ncbi:hypothetical protein MicroSTF_14565 [Microbacterium sp. STF-2]|uniref:hypothetical protein n=1 Tax=Microbacterium sp. STF-2 TaxID=3031132 RepID=UPI002AFE6511|nr:hypothetical protein [Microbacterium sp. STF-2]MEA1264263.1 hypothetical protein [Microbacterium sp. STF-2]
MRPARFVVPLIAALALVGCAPMSPASAAEKCGGGEAGINVDDEGVLSYDQSRDATGDAWSCLLAELVPDKDDQYTITQGLDGAPARDMKVGGYTVVYALNSERGIQLFFNP